MDVQCICEDVLNLTRCIIVLLRQNPGHNLEFSCGGQSKIHVGQSPYFPTLGLDFVIICWTSETMHPVNSPAFTGSEENDLQPIRIEKGLLTFVMSTLMGSVEDLVKDSVKKYFTTEEIIEAKDCY